MTNQSTKDYTIIPTCVACREPAEEHFLCEVAGKLYHFGCLPVSACVCCQRDDCEQLMEMA